jgi:hypothetical protein
MLKKQYAHDLHFNNFGELIFNADDSFQAANSLLTASIKKGKKIQFSLT